MVSQNVTTDKGKEYTVSFNLMGHPSSVSGTEIIEVYWDGVPQGQFTSEALGTQTLTDLKATGENTEVRFVDVTQTQTPYGSGTILDIVDGVTITEESGTGSLSGFLLSVGVMFAVGFVVVHAVRYVAQSALKHKQDKDDL
jgi:hypothetical protein